MIKLNPNIRLQLIVSLIIFISVFINYLNFNTATISTIVYLPIGFAIGLLFIYGTKVIPNIFLSVFVGQFLAITFLTSATIINSLLISLLLSSSVLFGTLIMNRIMLVFKNKSKIDISGLLFYYLGTLVVSVICGTLTATGFYYIFGTYTFLDLFAKWSTAFFFGIMIISSVVIFSHYYNESLNLSFKSIVKSLLFIFVFAIFASLLFSNYFSWFTYEKYSFFFIVFFIILSFSFSFRMILIIDVLYVLIFRLFLDELSGSLDMTSMIFSINTYLFILSTISILIKHFLNDLNEKNISISESTIKLNSLVYSTESLLKLSDDLLDNPINIKEDYLKRIFSIASNIFDNFDYASCYIKEDPFVTYIAASGYDLDVLNSFKFDSNNFDFIDVEAPIHVKKASKSVEGALSGKYENYKEIYPELKESIRFGIYIDESTVGGFSFDIIKGSNKEFNEVHLESYKSLQKLLNGFFSINYLNYKNISLKNDIVLSLIRTLELFDKYTGGHSEEVAYLANEIAKKLDLCEKEIHDIYWAGVVHDIGKVGISSDIINKPEKLNLEEYEVIKDHAVFGYEILNKADDLKTIAILVKHHHEWWNGSGYPSRLKENNIPIGSQIIAICDAVSTMAKKRPYTVAKTSKQIVEELEMYKGTQFSPKPTEAMIEFINDGLLDDFYKGR